MRNSSIVTQGAYLKLVIMLPIHAFDSVDGFRWLDGQLGGATALTHGFAEVRCITWIRNHSNSRCRAVSIEGCKMMLQRSRVLLHSRLFLI
jgi:hypothetical protein